MTYVSLSLWGKRIVVGDDFTIEVQCNRSCEVANRGGYGINFQRFKTEDDGIIFHFKPIGPELTVVLNTLHSKNAWDFDTLNNGALNVVLNKPHTEVKWDVDTVNNSGLATVLNKPPTDDTLDVDTVNNSGLDTVLTKQPAEYKWGVETRIRDEKVKEIYFLNSFKLKIKPITHSTFLVYVNDRFLTEYDCKNKNITDTEYICFSPTISIEKY